MTKYIIKHSKIQMYFNGSDWDYEIELAAMYDHMSIAMLTAEENLIESSDYVVIPVDKMNGVSL